MSVKIAKAGIKARLQTLVTEGKIRKVLNGAPTSAQSMPLVYMELRNGTRTQSMQTTSNKYYIAVVLAVAYQDNTIAEDQLDELVNDVAAVIDNDPTLRTSAGAVNFSTGSDWTAGYDPVGEVLSRTATWIITVSDNGVRRSGI